MGSLNRYCDVIPAMRSYIEMLALNDEITCHAIFVSQRKMRGLNEIFRTFKFKKLFILYVASSV